MTVHFTRFRREASTSLDSSLHHHHHPSIYWAELNLQQHIPTSNEAASVFAPSGPSLFHDKSKLVMEHSRRAPATASDSDAGGGLRAHHTGIKRTGQPRHCHANNKSQRAVKPGAIGAIDTLLLQPRCTHTQCMLVIRVREIGQAVRARKPCCIAMAQETSYMPSSRRRECREPSETPPPTSDAIGAKGEAAQAQGALHDLTQGLQTARSPGQVLSEGGGGAGGGWGGGGGWAFSSHKTQRRFRVHHVRRLRWATSRDQPCTPTRLQPWPGLVPARVG